MVVRFHSLSPKMKMFNLKCKFGVHDWAIGNPGPRNTTGRKWILIRYCKNCKTPSEYGYKKSEGTDEIEWKKVKKIK